MLFLLTIAVVSTALFAEPARAEDLGTPALNLQAAQLTEGSAYVKWAAASGLGKTGDAYEFITFSPRSGNILYPPPVSLLFEPPC